MTLLNVIERNFILYLWFTNCCSVQCNIYCKKLWLLWL